jgi:hypothetical protein
VERKTKEKGREGKEEEGGGRRRKEKGVSI